MRHKTFWAAVMLAVFAALMAGGCGGNSSYLASVEDSTEDSTQFTFAEYPWVNSNIIGRFPESYRPSPQDDFYVWKNHGWLTSAALKPGRSTAASYRELGDSINEKLTSLMTDTSLQGHDAGLVQNLYALWLDWDSRNSEGVKKAQTAFNVIKSIDSLSALTAYVASRDVNAEDLPSLYNYSVQPDLNDSKYYCLYITPAALRLGDAAEYTALTANGEKVKAAADAKALYMLQRLGCSESEAQEFMTRAYDFEKAIAGYIMTNEEYNLPENLDSQNNPVTYDQLRQMSPVFPLADMLLSADFDSDRLNLEQPKWLEGMNTLYTDSNLEGMKAYLILHTAVDRYIAWSDEAAFRENQKINNERRGITQSAPDTEEAFNLVNTLLPNSIARIFVSKYVDPKTKEDVTEMIHDVIAEYRTMLAGEEWLSETTRAKAIEKLDAIKVCAAYPDRYSDSEIIESLNIGTSADGETLLSAIEKIYRFKYAYKLSLLNTEVDRDLWAVEQVAVVNAYYDTSRNSIVIPAGILGGVFYDPEASLEENLGGIGAVIGHEVSHAFDPTGSQYDKDGNLSSWWTEEDFAAFNSRAGKLINYANSITILEDGTKWNGSLTQGETVADIVGVKVIMNIAAKTEGFDYEKFFEANALSYRMVATPKQIRAWVQTDVHPIDYLRVNAVLQMFPEFHATYGTKSGDRMYLSPEKIKELEVW